MGAEGSGGGVGVGVSSGDGGDFGGGGDGGSGSGSGGGGDGRWVWGGERWGGMGQGDATVSEQAREPPSQSISSPKRRLLRCLYRCRHRQELLPCSVEIVFEGGESPSRWGGVDDKDGARAEKGDGAVGSSFGVELGEVWGGGGGVIGDSGGGSGGGGGGGGGSDSVKNAVGPEGGGAFPAAENASKGAAECLRPRPSPDKDDRTVPNPAQPPPPPSLSPLLVKLHFDEPAKAVTPGQVVALYREGVCLGGGPILRAEQHCSPVLLRPPPPAPPTHTRLPGSASVVVKGEGGGRYVVG